MKNGHILKMSWLISKTPKQMCELHQSCKGILRDATPLTLTMELEKTNGWSSNCWCFSDASWLLRVRTSRFSQSETCTRGQAFGQYCAIRTCVSYTFGKPRVQLPVWAHHVSIAPGRTTQANIHRVYTSENIFFCDLYIKYIDSIACIFHTKISRWLGPKTPPLATQARPLEAQLLVLAAQAKGYGRQPSAFLWPGFFLRDLQWYKFEKSSHTKHDLGLIFS